MEEYTLVWVVWKGPRRTRWYDQLSTWVCIWLTCPPRSSSSLSPSSNATQPPPCILPPPSGWGAWLSTIPDAFQAFLRRESEDCRHHRWTIPIPGRLTWQRNTWLATNPRPWALSSPLPLVRILLSRLKMKTFTRAMAMAEGIGGRVRTAAKGEFFYTANSFVNQTYWNTLDDLWTLVKTNLITLLVPTKPRTKQGKNSLMSPMLCR